MSIRAFTALLTLTLLLQSVAPSWAAMPVMATPVVAEEANPPCHGAADEAQTPAEQPDMSCCGDLEHCRCAIGCGATPALATRAIIGFDYLRPSIDHHTAAPQPRTAHPTRLLRPPAVPAES